MPLLFFSLDCFLQEVHQIKLRRDSLTESSPEPSAPPVEQTVSLGFVVHFCRLFSQIKEPVSPLTAVEVLRSSLRSLSHCY